MLKVIDGHDQHSQIGRGVLVSLNATVVLGIDYQCWDRGEEYEQCRPSVQDFGPSLSGDQKQY